jgi:hypothetical protein
MSNIRVALSEGVKTATNGKFVIKEFNSSREHLQLSVNDSKSIVEVSIPIPDKIQNFDLVGDVRRAYEKQGVPISDEDVNIVAEMIGEIIIYGVRNMLKSFNS